MLDQGRIEIPKLNHNNHGDRSTTGHYHFALYGIKLCSDVWLPGLMESEFNNRNIRFTWKTGTVRNEISGSSASVKRFTTNVGTDLVVSDFGTGYSLLWEGKCEFEINHDGSEINCVSDAEIEFGWMLALLYSMVISFSLHLQGISNIHAGCVSIGNGSVALMAEPGTGKSSLTAVMAANGYPFLTDDILAITKADQGYEAHPGFPAVSLTRESASVVLSEERIHRYEQQFTVEKARIEIDSQWASFAPDSVPLTAVILLARGSSDSDPKPEQLSQIEATRAVLENTVCLPFLPKTALEAYLSFAGQLSASVPVWKMYVPGNLSDMAEISPNIVSEIATQTYS